MPKYITISVSGIGPMASEGDVRSYFETRLPGCDPIVSPLARNLNNGTKVATVTFTRKSKSACREAVRMLDEEVVVMRDAVGFSSTLAFDQTFLDLTLLTSRSPQPAFDVYFVHGLGGRAFNSFATKPRDHKKARMWARDFLPDTLDDSSLGSGRYLTFGYPATLIDRDRVTQGVQDNAENLLRQIIDERGKDCTRPIFFVCHSLGGLVVSQAILLALQDHEEGSTLWEIQKALLPSGECLIKGITFFGTPFGGSIIANVAAGLTKYLCLPINSSQIRYLRIRDAAAAKIVNEFLDRTTELRIPLLLFYELIPEKIGFFRKLIVHRSSALGRFGDHTKKVGLRASHRGMVKFKSPQDRLYEKTVSPTMQSFVHTVLRERQRKIAEQLQDPRLTALQHRAPPPRVIQLPQQQEGYQIQPKTNTSIVKGGVDFDQHNIVSDNRALSFPSYKAGWLEELVRELELNYDVFQEDRKEKIDISSGTCDWILAKPIYKDFISSPRNEVLFIQGGPGRGKSALAKFLALELAKVPILAIEQGPRPADDADPNLRSPIPTWRPIVVEFFSRKEGRDNSPKSILMHLLLQVFRADPALFANAASELFSKFSQQRDLEFYWTLFTRIRKRLETNLFCIIDGLDECIRQHRPEGQTAVDQQMVKFLTQLCGIAHKHKSNNESWTTKVLLTTRFEQEIPLATRKGGVLLEILSTDIEESVKKVVAKELFLVADGRSISTKDQEFAMQEILKTCGPVFQKGLTAVTILAEIQSLDWTNPDAIRGTLDAFNFQNYDDVYYRVLERIQLYDQPIAAKIIRILFFARNYLSMDELQHALAVDKENPTAKDLERPPSQDSIQNLIRSSLGTLISITGHNRILDLEHQSIYDFLGALSNSRLQMFSCKDKEEGHLHLALICLRYLTLWRHRVPSEAEIVAADGDISNAVFIGSQFFDYAAQNWHIHVRNAGELIRPYHALVDKLLGVQGTIDKVENAFQDYNFMMLYHQWTQEWLEEEFKPELMSPLHFISMHGLENVVWSYLKPQKKLSRRSNWKIFRKAPSVLDHPFNLDIEDDTGATPLHYACENGYLGTATLLLGGGARGNTLCKNGHSPFSIALQGGYETIAELLIETGQAFAGIDLAKEARCIHLASHGGMPKIVKYLLEKDNDPNVKALDGWTPVHMAAQEGHIETLKLLLDKGGSMVEVNVNGVTPLHSAALYGRLDVVELLFQRNPELDPVPRTTSGSMVPGATPLYYAARNGHLRTFNFLRAKQATVIPAEDGSLPIHAAADFGHMAIVSQFQDLEVINVRRKDERQPIHLAAQSSHVEVFNYLKAKGAEMSPDSYGYLPMHLAAANGCLPIVEQFTNLEDINAQTKTGTLPAHLAARRGYVEIFLWLNSHGSLATPDEDGYLPIHMAADEGHATIIKEFRGSPDIQSATKTGWLPVHLAADGGHLEVIKVLKELGADIDAKMADMNDEDCSWATPMYLAAQNRHGDLVQYLIDQGGRIDFLSPSKYGLLHIVAYTGLRDVFLYLLEHGQDPLARDDAGTTPLHTAAAGNAMDVVEYYIELGKTKSIDIDTQNMFGTTPFFSALTDGHTEVAKKLLDAGASANARSVTNVTALMLAAQNDDQTMLKKILDAGVDVNAAEDRFGVTAAHLAARRGSLSACRLLIDHDIDINCQTKTGWTPLMGAGMAFDMDCVEFLLAHGADPLLRENFGQCFVDHIGDRQPIRKLLEKFTENHTPLSEKDLDELLKKRVREFLSSLPDEVPTKPSMERLAFEATIDNLAFAFFRLKDYARGRICYEMRVFALPGSDRQLEYECFRCRERASSTSFWVCKSCPAATGLCVTCYENREVDGSMPGCLAEHEYFEIGGDDWARLKPGHINMEGKTEHEFLAELKSEFGVDGDGATPRTAAGGDGVVESADGATEKEEGDDMNTVNTVVPA